MSAPNWDAWQFLLGEWIGEGAGEPGEGSGGFTFQFDLQQSILVRRNYANYPATSERPAFTHDDLMIIYQSNAESTHAIYFDNEGHIINYAVEFSPDQQTLTFLGDVTPAAPRFRFVYTKTGADSVAIDFAIAPPGQPDQFASYIQAHAHRKK